MFFTYRYIGRATDIFIVGCMQPAGCKSDMLAVHPCIRIVYNLKKMTVLVTLDTYFSLFILFEILTLCNS